MHYIRVNFAKDYKINSYNETQWMGKNLRDKNLLTTLETNSYLKIFRILKL
jgi:hypothetical protein